MARRDDELAKLREDTRRTRDLLLQGAARLNQALATLTDQTEAKKKGQGEPSGPANESDQ